jgi:hypothetical protein
LFFSHYLLSKTRDLLVTINYLTLSSVERSKKLHGRACPANISLVWNNRCNPFQCMSRSSPLQSTRQAIECSQGLVQRLRTPYNLHKGLRRSMEKKMGHPYAFTCPGSYGHFDNRRHERNQILLREIWIS